MAQLFAPGHRESSGGPAVGSLSTAMSLTKSDLVEALQQFKSEFKSELRAELKADLSKELQDFKDALNDKLTTLRTNVDSVGARVLDAETMIQTVDQRVSAMQGDLRRYSQQTELLHLKVEDLENRSCREYICIKSLRETAEGPDIQKFIPVIFQSLLPEDVAPIRLDRVHRVGQRIGASDRAQQDMLAKFHDYQVKEEVLAAAREKDSVSFDGNDCALFQDMAPSTLARRQLFRPIMEKLRSEGVKYR